MYINYITSLNSHIILIKLAFICITLQIINKGKKQNNLNCAQAYNQQRNLHLELKLSKYSTSLTRELCWKSVQTDPGGNICSWDQRLIDSYLTS